MERAGQSETHVAHLPAFSLLTTKKTKECRKKRCDSSRGRDTFRSCNGCGRKTNRLRPLPVGSVGLRWAGRGRLPLGASLESREGGLTRVDEAVAHYSEAHRNLGRALAGKGQVGNAIAHWSAMMSPNMIVVTITS